MVFFNPTLEIALVSVAMSGFSQIVQMKFGNKKQLKEHQDKMKSAQGKIKELAAKTDEKSKKERTELEAGMLESMNMVMKSSMKTMAIMLVVVIPVFALAGSVYDKEVISLPFPVPWLAPDLQLLSPLSWFHIYSETNWLGWYVLVSLIFSILILNPLIKIYEKKMAGK